MIRTADKGEVLLAVTVDVEEEGLFRGDHPRRAAGLGNVAHLRRLEFVTRRLGLPLTLLATHAVLADPGCRQTLLRWRDGLGAELGAHLHVWSTPPFGAGEPWQAHGLPAKALRAKLDRLLADHRRWTGAAALSLRMGRFETTEDLRDYLPATGLTVDSSLVPLRAAGRPYPPFLAPADPHPWVEGGPGQGRVWQAPLTVVPVLAGSDSLAWRMAARLPRRSAQGLLQGFRYVAAAGTQPTMFSGAAMRLAARLHLGRGGRVITMYLHSSELMPGGSPAYATPGAVDALLGRILRFLEWLGRNWRVRGVTLAQLPFALAAQEGRQA